MSQKNSDKKLNRFSTIIEIITNLGTIGSWILSAGSAYVLNVQRFPVVVPGINFTLDLDFQFSLVLCSILAYIHFLQNYWKKNKEKLSLPDSYMEFSFWELPRLKHPLFLIPIVIIIAVCVQTVAESVWLLVIFLLILVLVIYFTIRTFSYHLSPNREYEVLLQAWNNNAEWRERWFRRITTKLDKYGKVKVNDLYEVGIGFNEKAKLEIGFALGQYFDKHEFEKDLILMKTSKLPYGHPERDLPSSSEWILMYRENLNDSWKIESD